MLSRKVVRTDDSPSSVRQTPANGRCQSPGERKGADKSDRFGALYPTGSGRSNGTARTNGVWVPAQAYTCYTASFPHRRVSRDPLLNYCPTRDYARCRSNFGCDGIVLIPRPGDVITVVAWKPHRLPNGSGLAPLGRGRGVPVRRAAPDDHRRRQKENPRDRPAGRSGVARQNVIPSPHVGQSPTYPVGGVRPPPAGCTNVRRRMFATTG